MVESENSENEENKPDEEKKPDEETKPDLSRFENFLYIDLEQIQAVIDDAQPMIEAFWTIWTEEKTEQDQLDLFTAKGMPGAVGRIIDQIIPPTMFSMSPDSFILLAQRCVLFGYCLDEVKRRVGMDTETSSSTDELAKLDKLWNVTEGDEPTNGTE